MAGNVKNSVSKAQNETHRRILQQLLKHEDNRRCADCLARGPTWASVNLGVFVCLNCSGVHRSLGVEISKVRSTTLDTWLPEQVAFVQSMGNRRANMYWEGHVKKDFRRPTEGDMSALRTFINDKYREGFYALRTWDKPPTIETYQVHPFMKQFEEGSSSGVTDSDSVTIQPGSDRRPDGTFAADPSQVSSRARGKVIDAGNLPAAEASKASQSFGSRLQKPPSGPSKQAQRTGNSPVSPQLFDLLSLEEPESAPSPSVEDVLLGSSATNVSRSAPAAVHGHSLSQESLTGVSVGEDAGWAAFEGDQGATPSQPNGAADVTDDTWDAFQDSSPTEAKHISNSSIDPFQVNSSGEKLPGLHEAEFKPNLPVARDNTPQNPSKSYLNPASHTAQPQRSPSQGSARQQTSHRSQKSMEEIMALFETPSRTADFFGKPAPSQTASTNTFQADFPPLSADSSNLGEIQLPPDFWSPDFKAPQVQSVPVGTYGAHNQNQSMPGASSHSNLDADWAAFAK